METTNIFGKDTKIPDNSYLWVIIVGAIVILIAGSIMTNVVINYMLNNWKPRLNMEAIPGGHNVELQENP